MPAGYGGPACAHCGRPLRIDAGRLRARPGHLLVTYCENPECPDYRPHDQRGRRPDQGRD